MHVCTQAKVKGLNNILSTKFLYPKCVSSLDIELWTKYVERLLIGNWKSSKFSAADAMVVIKRCQTAVRAVTQFNHELDECLAESKKLCALPDDEFDKVFAKYLPDATLRTTVGNLYRGRLRQLELDSGQDVLPLTAKKLLFMSKTAINEMVQKRVRAAKVKEGILQATKAAQLVKEQAADNELAQQGFTPPQMIDDKLEEPLEYLVRTSRMLLASWSKVAQEGLARFRTTELAKVPKNTFDPALGKDSEEAAAEVFFGLQRGWNDATSVHDHVYVEKAADTLVPYLVTNTGDELTSMGRNAMHAMASTVCDTGLQWFKKNPHPTTVQEAKDAEIQEAARKQKAADEEADIALAEALRKQKIADKAADKKAAAAAAAKKKKVKAPSKWFTDADMHDGRRGTRSVSFLVMLYLHFVFLFLGPLPSACIHLY